MKLARMPDGSSEIFHTLQGEGRNAGRPSVFIRASLCNLSCYWCDTPYTWNWEGSGYEHEDGRTYRREEQILDLAVPEVAERAASFGCPNFVFTGGEPLLQEGDWVELMNELSSRRAGSRYEIETNGTLRPGEIFVRRIDQINVSPKLENSRVPESDRSKPEVIEFLAATGKADFKFVVASEYDYAEIRDLVAATTIPPERVFLMPEASDLEELDRRQALVAALAREHGHRYSDRLHLRLYGAKRGV